MDYATIIGSGGFSGLIWAIAQFVRATKLRRANGTKNGDSINLVNWKETVTSNIGTLTGRVAQETARVDALNRELDRAEGNTDALSMKLDSMVGRIESIAVKIDNSADLTSSRVQAFGERVEEMERDMSNVRAGQKRTEQAVYRLEKRLSEANI